MDDAVHSSPDDACPVAPLLTVEEAARVLRIGRSLAYQLAAEYDTSGGVSGMPVIHIGGCLRVPRWALLELALTGRVVRVCDADVAHAIDALLEDVPHG